MPRKPGSVNRHIGCRIRKRRLEVVMSQERLGGLLGITFQQLQKYENGTNRISAERLHYVAHILNVPFEYFIEGAPAPEKPDSAS